jgi:hypothetical protein
MELLPMSSVAASPAKISARLVRGLGLMARAAAYGRNTPDLLARFVPDTSSWKTSQLCLVEGLTEFSETWPRSGMMQSGIAYQLPPLAPLTDEIAFGLWPTPDTMNHRDGSKLRKDNNLNQGGRHGVSLHHAVWATPSVCGNYNRKGASATSGDGLATQVGGRLNPTWVEWLMGYPIGWTALEGSATPSSRKSRKSSAGQS